MTQRKRAVNFILRVLCLLIAFACVTLLCWQYLSLIHISEPTRRS